MDSVRTKVSSSPADLTKSNMNFAAVFIGLMMVALAQAAPADFALSNAISDAVEAPQVGLRQSTPGCGCKSDFYGLCNGQEPLKFPVVARMCFLSCGKCLPGCCPTSAPTGTGAGK
ncbi:uncharacterized protein LOC132192751 [Neocloeon triangulifer]|uniref:uncharacterized protein LOC132192751 n=1 Tax=Neocloeon triangulifer TaxID=2078957 RepID=UPI00286ED998|nr:uncharacterized protein LOC132192751 [Neocloeon triangulifer]